MQSEKATVNGKSTGSFVILALLEVLEVLEVLEILAIDRIFYYKNFVCKYGR